MSGLDADPGPRSGPDRAPGDPEVDIGEGLVRCLLTDQHPDLDGLALTRVAQGLENAVWRLGEDLAVRLPVRTIASELMDHEQVVLPVLGPRLQVVAPVPLR